MTVKYHPSGLWIERQEDALMIGFSKKGQQDIGEIMFASLMPLQDRVDNGEAIVGVEGEKAVTDITSPVSGRILAINELIDQDHTILNSDVREDTWLILLQPDDLSVWTDLSTDPLI